MVKKLLPHFCIILSVMFMVFYFIDQVNSAMNFINNDITKTLLLIQCISVIMLSIIVIAQNRREI